MSLKPPKKGDKCKHWMQKRRDRSIKIMPEYHLIITEGKKTEPQYFNTIRDVINQQYRERIQLDVYGEGDNTINLFDLAKKRVLQSPNGYSHVWIVFDTDSFPSDHINRVEDYCVNSCTESTKYHAIWSNQCIELWYLLHFCFFHSDIDRNLYFPKLSECLSKIGAGDYHKNRNDMYRLLYPFIDTAIDNARKLDFLNKGKTPAKSAPGTRMYVLVEKLKPYLK